MKRTGAGFIVYLAEQHGFVIWDRGVPQILLSRDPVTRQTLAPLMPAIRGILRRVGTFYQQLHAPGPPFLRYGPARSGKPGKGCATCGGRFVEEYEVKFGRCDLCQTAIEVAMECDPARPLATAPLLLEVKGALTAAPPRKRSCPRR